MKLVHAETRRRGELAFPAKRAFALSDVSIVTLK